MYTKRFYLYIYIYNFKCILYVIETLKKNIWLKTLKIKTRKHRVIFCFRPVKNNGNKVATLVALSRGYF